MTQVTHQRGQATFVVATAMLCAVGCVWAGDAAEPLELVEEVPTLQCLGVRWWVGGDDNANASIALQYRRSGATEWRRGLDLFRVERGSVRGPSRREATLFAGSVFYLEEDTEYEVNLSLDDPDGGGEKRILRMRTWAEPAMPKDGKSISVLPGQLRAALAKAEPGHMLVLTPGIYRGTFTPPSGTSGQPIAIVGSPTGGTVFDGEGAVNIIAASGLRHVMFKRITFRNAKWAIAVNGGSHITVQHCRIEDVDYAFVGQKNGKRQKHFYIADNVILGRSTWPRQKGIESRRGVQVGGQGHVICYNRISGFADAIDTFPAYPCSSIDIYRNDISECTDDGIEMDYSEHNTRCFENRLSNVYQGISLQPVHGGPVYVFRNSFYNVVAATFKLHNSPSGGLMFHNTSVKSGMPLLVYTSAPVRNCISRNNLFVGTQGNYAYESTAPMVNCDFDYDGFCGEWHQFLKWNKKRYRAMEDAQADGLYRHAVRIAKEGTFLSGIEAPEDSDRQFPTDVNDLRLAPNSEAVNRGTVVRNISDNYTGNLPDLGAYESGSALLHYGPRADRDL